MAAAVEYVKKREVFKWFRYFVSKGRLRLKNKTKKQQHKNKTKTKSNKQPPKKNTHKKNKTKQQQHTNKQTNSKQAIRCWCLIANFKKKKEDVWLYWRSEEDNFPCEYCQEFETTHA